MASYGHGIPAWQTDDLAEEWVEEEEEEEGEIDGDGQPPSPLQPPTQTIQSTFNARGSYNFGSTNVDVRNTSQEVEQTTTQVGTFLVHSDLPAANLPQTPALAKKTNGIKDIFTPLQLERMFDPPSPPKLSPSPTQTPQRRLGSPSRQRTTSRPAKPSKLSQVVGASVLEDKSELRQSVGRQDEIVVTHIPNIVVPGEAKPTPTCRFTFSVPHSARRFPSRVNFNTPIATTPTRDSYTTPKLRLQSTPFPSSRSQRLTNQQPNPNDSRLRLFQFQYDTYTREHLSAIVDSFGVSSPSNISSSRQSVGTVLINSPAQEDEREDPETFSRLRAAKRLKLTPPSELIPDEKQQHAHRQAEQPPMRDYVGESKSFMQHIKRARGFSLASAADGTEQEPNCPIVLTDSTNTQQQVDQAPSGPFVPSASSSTSTVNANAFGSKSSAMAYRKQAAELMAKIKGDPRLVSGRGDTSFISQKSEDDVPNVQERSWAPSPESRPRSPVKRSLEDKENRPELFPDAEPPSYAASIARSQFGANRGGLEGAFNMFPNSRFPSARNAQRIVVMPVAIPEVVEADRLRSPNPTYLAPPPTALGSMRAQVRSSSTNEDLNRLVSSGSTATTATTLTVASAGSGVKHAGPAQMVRIAPADLPSIPERVGGMIFDRTLGRWIKERGSSDRTLARSSSGQTLKGSPARTEVYTESEDPFRDIESLRDGEEDHSPVVQEISEFALAEIDDSREGSGGTEDMHIVSSDSDSEFDDAEDAQLSTFTFDCPPEGVVQVMTGEDDDLSEVDEGDATTDSENNSEAENGEPAVEGEVDEDFYNNLASISIRDEQPEVEEGASTAMADADPRLWHAGQTVDKYGYAVTPCKPPRRPVRPPRSALKSASVTPISRGGAGRGRSVSFSDGRKDGKIVGLHAAREREEAANRAAGMLTADNLRSVPSVRSKRIMEMLDDLEESLLEDDEAEQQAEQQYMQADALSSASDAMQKNANLTVVSPRSFARSQTIRRPGQSSPRRVNTPSRTNATFLTECSFGVAHDRLVEVITDVQPFEPYWESLSSVDLSGRRLDSVARLKEFLPKLDSLNLNNNLLSWLSGVPGSVRTLTVASNALTSLTSFGHLLNLENLDISYNDLDSLQQISCLRHLRELRADGNKIAQLNGLENFDGLLKLSVEGNVLREVDLTGFRWSRLELLNLSNNELESVRGLHAGRALVSINLDNNCLTGLDHAENNSGQDPSSVVHAPILQKLRILRLSGNRLKYLDVTRFPSLRTLYVDNNCLADGRAGQRGQGQKRPRQKLFGLHRLSKLEHFSARNQSAPGARDSCLRLEINEMQDVKRLYLSGNPFPIPFGTDATQACYNLVYLELAACRITSLPANFSSLVPNVRSLNLNYNFLETDEVARGLAGLKRLRKLTLVGNRMSGTKAIFKLLSGMGHNIEMLDFRMNPCTLGWYLPLLVQGKDGGALLQPSEPPKGEHYSPFISAFPPDARIATEVADPDEAPRRGIANVPSSSGGRLGRLLESGAQVATSSPTKAVKLKRNTSSNWEALDAQFRRGLPDKAYKERLGYRGLIMRACPRIEVLDGVRVAEKERRKAEAMLKHVLKEADAAGAGTRTDLQR